MGEVSAEVGGLHDAGAAAAGDEVALARELPAARHDLAIPGVGARGAMASHHADDAHAIDASQEVFEGIIDGVAKDGSFLSIDSSIFNITTPNDPALPRELVLDPK